MKKILFLILLVSSTAFAQKGYRFTTVPGSDNRFLNPPRETKAVTYAATIAIAPTQEFTVYSIALTGAATINATITNCYTGDKMNILFSADGTNRVVTFGTNFSSNGTLTVTASTHANASFIFNGTAWQEITRQNLTGTVTNLTASGTISADAITEYTSGAGITFSKATIRKGTATTKASTATLTAAQLAGGIILSTNSTADTLTLPTATDIATAIGAAQGTVFEFVVDGTGASGTTTIAVNTGVTVGTTALTGGNTLTVSTANATACFRLVFTSTTAAILRRIF